MWVFLNRVTLMVLIWYTHTHMYTCTDNLYIHIEKIMEADDRNVAVKYMDQNTQNLLRNLYYYYSWSQDEIY